MPLYPHRENRGQRTKKIKAMNTALSFLSAMKQINRTEWAGPCPFCGDGGKGAESDRFHFWTDNPNGGQGGRYWCRKKCDLSRRSGDGVQLVQLLEGVGYKEAVAMLGGEVKASFSAMGTKSDCTVHVPSVPSQNRHTPARMSEVADAVKWQTVAAQFLSSCQRDLTQAPSQGAIEYLICKRHISPSTAIDCNVGYYSGNAYPEARLWGIDTQATKSGKIRVPGPGIVIATKRGGKIVGIHTHFDKPELNKATGKTQKSMMIKGSRKIPFLAGQSGKPCFVVESALDACLLVQEGAGKICAIAMNGAGKNVDEDCRAFVMQAPYLVLCGDRDLAGENMMDDWRSLFGHLRPCYKQFCIGAKDIGEMHHKAFMELTGEVPTAAEFVKAVLANREARP